MATDSGSKASPAEIKMIGVIQSGVLPVPLMIEIVQGMNNQEVSNALLLTGRLSTEEAEPFKPKIKAKDRKFHTKSLLEEGFYSFDEIIELADNLRSINFYDYEFLFPVIIQALDLENQSSSRLLALIKRERWSDGFLVDEIVKRGIFSAPDLLKICSMLQEVKLLRHWQSYVHIVEKGLLSTTELVHIGRGGKRADGDVVIAILKTNLLATKDIVEMLRDKDFYDGQKEKVYEAVVDAVAMNSMKKNK